MQLCRLNERYSVASRCPDNKHIHRPVKTASNGDGLDIPLSIRGQCWVADLLPMGCQLCLPKLCPLQARKHLFTELNLGRV